MSRRAEECCCVGESMLSLTLRRLVTVIPTLLVVSFAVFMLTSLLPGDPAVSLAGGADASPERIQAVRDQLRLDDPLLVRYGAWLSDIMRFDFGESAATGRKITDEVKERFPVTLSIAGMAAAVALLIGVPVGVATGFRPGGAADSSARLFANISVAVPNFLLGPLLVVVFAVKFRLLPPSGYTPLGDSVIEWAKHLVMPAVALGTFLAASLSRQLRSAVIEVMGQNFIRTLWANGTRRRTILFKHVLRNASGPGLTLFALSLGSLLGGTVIVEQIFALRGIGNYMLSAITARDLPIIQGMTIVFVLTQLTISLFIDLSQAALNPRLRTA